MEERTIKINLDTARKWYLSRDSFKQELALRVFTKEELEEPNLPKSWEEYLDDRRYVVEKDYSRNLITLKHLLILRDVYRQGWKPDWTNGSSKFCLGINFNVKIEVLEYTTIAYIFSFQTEYLAEQFLENFKDELEQLKELL